LTYSNLEDLEAAISGNSVDGACIYPFILQLLRNSLQNSLDRYNDLVTNKYDSKFDTFANAMVKSAPKQVKDFMHQNGNKYFTCQVTELQLCCEEECQNIRVNPNGHCRYCYTGKCDYARFKRDSGGPGNMGLGEHIVHRWLTMDEPCPPDYSMRGLSQGLDLSSIHDTVRWNLRPDMVDQFYTDLLNTTSVDKDSITFQDINNAASCAPNDDNCQKQSWDLGIPTPGAYDKSDITNPKDIIASGLEKFGAMNQQLSNILSDLGIGMYTGSADDVIAAISVPILMVAEAIDQMETVVETADEIDEAQRKSIILAFLGAILFFIPVVGEVLGSVAGLATLARIVAVIATAGDVAMDIYTIVDDPGNAPLAIFGLVLAPLGLLDVAAVAKAAGITRGLGPDTLGKLGKNVGPKMDVINKCDGVCRKA
jgi:hypothetical protein